MKKNMDKRINEIEETANDLKFFLCSIIFFVQLSVQSHSKWTKNKTILLSECCVYVFHVTWQLLIYEWVKHKNRIQKFIKKGNVKLHMMSCETSWISMTKWKTTKGFWMWLEINEKRLTVNSRLCMADTIAVSIQSNGIETFLSGYFWIFRSCHFSRSKNHVTKDRIVQVNLNHFFFMSFIKWNGNVPAFLF